MRPKTGLRLPRSLDFEVWGLSDNFTGERSIGLWDVDGGTAPFRESAHGFRDAAGSALVHATWKAAWCEPGIEGTVDTLEVLRPGDDLDAPEWGRHRLVAGGAEVEAHFLHVGKAWAAAADLPDVVIGVSGCGAEPDTYELAPIADLSQYACQPWPGERKRRAQGAG